MRNVMRHPFTKLSVAAAVAAAVIAPAQLAAANPSPTVISARTVTLIVRGGSATFINVRQRKSVAAGDEFIGTQPTYLPGQPDRIVGRSYVVITLLTKQATRDEVTLVLRHGQLDLSGVEAGNPFALAVTGGTGRFYGARGEAMIRTGGKDNRGTITIHLLS
jgi:hypothetical protein